MLQRCGCGFGYLALASLLNQDASAGSKASAESFDPLAARQAHFPARAKRVIYLHMSGGPPQHDLFDYKPVMNDWYDKDLPESVRALFAGGELDLASPVGYLNSQVYALMAPLLLLIFSIGAGAAAVAGGVVRLGCRWVRERASAWNQRSRRSRSAADRSMSAPTPGCSA